MNNQAQTGSDEVGAMLARFAAERRSGAGGETEHQAKDVLLDTIAVAMAATAHPVHRIAARYALNFHPAGKCALWGMSHASDAETAALVNASLTRCNDFNDLYIGTSNWGHPSDTIAPLVAVAEDLDRSGRDLIDAMAISFEVVVALFDCAPATAAGWDYSLLTMLGAVCGVGRLMGLDQEQIAQALGIAVVPHFPSDEVESGDLNARGDLTLWKRFNAGDAMRQAVYACFLASVGAEGAVRPFTGRLGFLAKLGLGPEFPQVLRAALDDVGATGAFSRLTMKRWPVGSRAQSAIQASLSARRQIDTADAIASVHVVTDPGVYSHLVAQRPTPWDPHSRETADHSLPYIVAATLAEGQLTPDSFDEAHLADPAIRRLLQAVEVTPSLYDRAYDELEYARRGYLSRVEITTTDGRLVIGEPELPPGHPERPMSGAQLEQKLRENAPAALRLDLDAIIAGVRDLERLSVRELASRLRAGSGTVG